MIRVLPAFTVTTTPQPLYSGPVTAAVSFSIANGIATINLGANNLPANGYNGPRGFGNAGPDLGVPQQGQQVMLWGFTTATYFNAKTVTVLDNNGAGGSFRFYFNHTNVALTNDTGNTAPTPVEPYRSFSAQTDAAYNGTQPIYIGDSNVSTSQFWTILNGKEESLGQALVWKLKSTNNRADRVWAIVPETDSTAILHVTLEY